MNERDDVGTDLLVGGGDAGEPFMTIGITTFKRPAYLIEAVRSALDQRFDRPYEIVVVDDDPASTSADALLDALPVLRTRSFRYYRQRRNLGIYHNFNRVLRYSRGEWMTILNDDDLLDPDYLERMFAELDAHPEIDGLIPPKHTLDERDDSTGPQRPGSRSAPGSSRFRNGLRMLGRKGGRAEFAKAAFIILITKSLFGKRRSRRIPVRKMFWGSILGTCCGFVFRRRNALAIGGFYEDETPSADFWFYTRYAKLFHLREYYAPTVTMRKAVNETAKRENVIRSFRCAYAVQRAIAAGDAPSWWLRMSPLVLAWHRADFRDQWRVDLTDQEIKEATGVQVAREWPKLVYGLRLLLRGL